MAATGTASRLLTRHFLRRLLDNDLLSSHADRHEAVSMSCAALISSGLFITVLLSVKYLLAPFPEPGAMALVSLDDKFLFIAASMIVMALVALAEWDALPLDERDTSILGPLPIARSVVVRAKMSALVLFAAQFGLVLNAGPSVLFPLFFAAKLPLSLVAIATLMATHFLVMSAAGAFGLLSVVGVHELLRALLGARWFRRVSTIVQASLVVLSVTAFLMLPATASRVSRWALSGDSAIAYVVPPLWFVGLYERLAGHVLDDLDRPRLPPRIATREREATAIYRRHRGLFRELAGMAVTALTVVALVAVVGYGWNNRRLPVPAVVRGKSQAWSRRMLAGLARRVLVRRPAAQAGFFFTLQTLPRSAPHRLAMATSLALGLALVTASGRGVDLRLAPDTPAGPLVLWAAQTMLLGTLLLGFRHAMRVPAHLRANASFHLAWSGDERGYLSGVKKAALVGAVAPMIALLFPLHVLALGPRLALAHLLCGLLLAVLWIDVMYLGLRQPPLACSYVPAASLKKVAPILVVAFWLLAYGVAAIERFALGRERPAASFFAGLVTLLVLVRALDAWQRRRRVAVEFDEAPATATQRLDLSG